MSEVRITYQCVDAEYVRTDSSNRPWYRAVIVTNDTDPDLSEIDPAEVRGFPRNAGFAAGSMILYPEDQHKMVYTDTSMVPGPTPGEDDSMIIHITATETAYTTDKTAAEIKEAMEDGKIVMTQYTDTPSDTQQTIGQLPVAAYNYDGESELPYTVMITDTGNMLIGAEHVAGVVFLEAPTDAEPLLCAKTQG